MDGSSRDVVAEGRGRWIMAAVVFAVAVAAHVHTASAPLVFDDSGWLWEARQAQVEGGGAPYFQPRLWILSNWLLFQVHRFAGERAAPYRAVHWFVHGINAAMLLFLVGAITSSTPAGIVAALLFALHPAPHGALYGIITFHHLLVLLFGQCALLGYLRAREGHRDGWLVSFAGVAAATITQESAVMLIPVLLLFHFVLGSRTHSEARKTIVLDLVWLAAFAVVLAWLFRTPGMRAGGDVRLGWHIPRNLVAYTSALLWPDPLLGSVTASPGRIVLLVGAFVAWIVAIVKGSRSSLLLGGWYVLAALPYCGYASGVASRHSYVPSAPFCGLLGLALVSVLWWSLHPGSLPQPNQVRGGSSTRRLFRVVAVVVVVAISGGYYAVTRSYDATYARMWGAVEQIVDRSARDARSLPRMPDRILLLDVPWDPTNQSATGALHLKLGPKPDVYEFRRGGIPPASLSTNALVERCQ